MVEFNHIHCLMLQYLPRNPGAGFGIGKILKKAFPELEKAMREDLPYTLELTLQEISQLFPGRRVRLDAYKRLTRFLATQHITLLLTSRKSKK